jgi:uncharacterized protein YbjQ (UPF0145 family)
MSDPYNQSPVHGASTPPPVPSARRTATGQPGLSDTMVTTAFELPGYRVVENLGVVRGIIVRSRSVVGSFLGGLQTLFGGNITIYTELCEQARSDTYRDMVAHARRLRANAIIGMRYDATEVMPGLTEVLCYGTAVIVERIDR